MRITRLDHAVMTVRNFEVTAAWYHRVLGLQVIRPGNRRVALRIGDQQIVLQVLGAEPEPHAATTLPGSAQFCFMTDAPLESVLEHLRSWGTPVDSGPYERQGAAGPLQCITVRDPDGNLIEIGTPVQKPDRLATPRQPIFNNRGG